MFTLKIRRVGNSAAVTLPKEVLAKLRVREGDTIVLEPTSLGDRGAAIAEHEGIRFRVYGAIPGESARVRVLHISRGGPVAEARFLEPAGEPHPARREVPCPIHDKCGGCGYTTATY